MDDVRKVDGRSAAVGKIKGEFTFGRALARVPTQQRRDTERNHTATHLLHAALRQVLGDAVHQAGSLVAPDRLRFDFTHHGPVNASRLDQVERIVNEQIWRASPVTFAEMPFAKAREASDKARGIEPNNLEVRYNEVSILEAEGKTPQAIQTLKDILSGTAKRLSDWLIMALENAGRREWSSPSCYVLWSGSGAPCISCSCSSRQAILPVAERGSRATISTMRGAL